MQQDVQAGAQAGPSTIGRQGRSDQFKGPRSFVDGPVYQVVHPQSPALDRDGVGRLHPLKHEQADALLTCIAPD